MELTGLKRKQQVALVALLEAMTLSDGDIAEGEEHEIGRIAEKLGEDNYRELLAEADERFPDEQRLKAFLASIHDQEVRDLIYGEVMENAMQAPSVGHAQTELLDWLKQVWNITVEEA